MAWKRYSNEAAATRDQNPRGVMFLTFRSAPNYIYAYYDVGYNQYRYFMDKTSSMGQYINAYLSSLNSYAPKFEYRRIYL